jgi:hypothetical protein
MVMSVLLTALLLQAAANGAGTVSVETATGDWSKLPQLNQRGYDHLDTTMRLKLYEIASSGQCPTFGLKQDRLDFRMGFAVQYDPSGKPMRILLPRLECPQAEGVAGGAVLEMLNGGDYVPSGKSAAGWYQGTLGFSFVGAEATDPAVLAAQAQPGAVTSPNQSETVCQKVEVLGSRLSTKSICMTRAEWAQRRKDDREAVERAQTQRGCKMEAGC